MKIPIYQVDAFTSTLFRGNPAAVCPLQAWLPDAQMQAIAAENNLKVGVPEDPVTGASHCTLVPYWSKCLCKTTLHAFQVSPRGGELFCEDLYERVKLAGQAVTYLEGNIYI